MVTLYFREILTLADGGEIGLDWLETGCDPKSPVILILPGLTGESQAEYIKCLALSANSIGVRCVVFNNRGLAGVQLKVLLKRFCSNDFYLGIMCNYFFKE